MEDHMEWLESQMGSRSAKKPVTEDLELVKRAADTIRRSEDCAAKTAAHAQTMVTHAQAELKIAERLLQESIAARLEAEAEHRKTIAKLEDSERLFEIRTEQVRKARVD